MKIFSLSILSMLLISCSHKKASYAIGNLASSPAVTLREWNYVILNNKGPNSKLNLEDDYLNSAGIASEAVFSKNLSFNESSSSNKMQILQGYKNSKESIIDFKEIDTVTLTGSAIYMYCTIESDRDQGGFILSRSDDGLKIWVNGHELLKVAKGRGFEQYFSDFVKVHLNKGSNKILIKKIANKPDLLIEVQLANFKIATNEYTKNANGLVFTQGIIGDTLKLKDNHTKCFGVPVSYAFRDIRGHEVYKTTKYPYESNDTIIAPLKDGQAYMCWIKLGTEIISEPFFKGNPDNYYSKRSADTTLMDKRTKMQIVPYLYRLDKLLKHESRKSDWWWSFKTADVIYELENIVANPSNNRQNDLSFGIRLSAYMSTLDSSIQHYLVITPDSLRANEKTPLVFVIRPFMENVQHFLTSPQMSRYWGLLWAKNLANKYHYVVVMPSIRLYGKEPMTPMAEAEIFEVIKDIGKYYDIDKNRMYLHGNCTAGFRSLVVAEHHPFTFAAVGLYAPVVDLHTDNPWILDNSPGQNIPKLKNVPMLLHFDPLDTHSPYSGFKDFIADCNNHDIPLQVSSKLNSGIHYNVQLVGEETLAFFKNKRKAAGVDADHSLSYHEKKKDPVILDFFSSPFLYVANHEDCKTHSKTCQIKDTIANEYEKLLFARCPIKYDTEITDNDLRTKNIFFIGHNFNNKSITERLKSVPLLIAKDSIKLNGQIFIGKHITFEAIFISPFNPEKYIIIYSTNSNPGLSRKLSAPWYRGFENKIVVKADR